MTKDTDTCDCSKCNGEQILEFAEKQAERAPEGKRNQKALGDMVVAITLHAIEHDLSLYDVIRGIATVHGEMTKQLARSARITDREIDHARKRGFVQ